MTDATIWLSDHKWVPILVGCVLLMLLGLLVTCLICKCRQRRRFDYTALVEDQSVPSKLLKEKHQKISAIRDQSWIAFQFYMRSNTHLDLIGQLSDIGSREEKWWFIVVDKQRRKEEQLASMVHRPTDFKLHFSSSTQSCLQEIFTHTQHPYVYPVSIDFAVQQNFIVTTAQCCRKGSLKDALHKSSWRDSWGDKYGGRGKPLSVKLTRLYGTQILEGLLYLEKVGYPPHDNLHAGNVLIDGGVCRLCGYENAFLGLKPLLHDQFLKVVKDHDKHAMCVLSFGHLLFEMSTGYKLTMAIADSYHLLQCNPDVMQVLNFIFFNDGSFPSLQQIRDQKFFASVRLLESAPVQPSHHLDVSPAAKSLLKAVRRGKPVKPKKKPKPSEPSKQSKAPEPSKKSKAQEPLPAVQFTSKPRKTSKTRQPPQPDTLIPPPPPPDLLPTIPVPQVASGITTERSALLSDIRKGVTLRPTSQAI